MGSEAKCRAVSGNGRTGARASGVAGTRGGGVVGGVVGTALLETDEIRFREAGDGGLRVRIALRDVTRVEAVGGVLEIVGAAGESLHLELGERVAARWAEKIRSPKGLLEKLGVKADTAIAIVGELVGELSSALEARASEGRSPEGPRRAASPAIVFLAAEEKRALSRVAALRKALRDDAAIWIVYPKGQAHLKELDVLVAGRAAGLKDVKVARVSETHTALKFVVPRAERAPVRKA